MTFRPTLADTAAIARPHNEALLKDLRASLFLERVREVARDLEHGDLTNKAATMLLRQALKDIEN